MKIRHQMLFAIVASIAICSVVAEPATGVRLEMWEGCLCSGPLHFRDYEQLKAERAWRMSFGTNVTVRATDAALAPLAFLKLHLAGNKMKDTAEFYRMGIVYRRATDGQTYSVFFEGALRRLKMRDMKEGDVIVYYKNIY